MNTKTSLICAAVLGFGFLTAAQAASSLNETASPITVAELSSGKTGRIAIPVPRPDPEMLVSDSGTAQPPVTRTSSGIRIVGAPFFASDAQ